MENLNESLNKSPMQSYITAFDNNHLSWGEQDYWAYANMQDFRFWNDLFVKEVEFRREFGLNLVWSDEGGQGNGKSMGLLRKKQIIDQLYGNTFDIKRFINEVHFFNEDLDEGLSNAKNRSCHVLDEQTRSHGLMVRFVEDQLANYEDTFRKPQINIGYASPALRQHSHFFIFQALGDIYVDKNGEITSVELMLKTKRQSDGLIAARGKLKLKAPEPELWAKYNEKKDDFILRMKSKQGGMMNRIEKDAEKVVKEAGSLLYRQLKDGSTVPVSGKSIKFLMYKYLGMRSYTVEGYELVQEAIKAKL